MAQNQQTSAQVSAIAAKAMQNPSSLSNEEIKTLASSVQNQQSQLSGSSSQQGQPGQQSQR